MYGLDGQQKDVQFSEKPYENEQILFDLTVHFIFYH